MREYCCECGKFIRVAPSRYKQSKTKQFRCWSCHLKLLGTYPSKQQTKQLQKLKALASLYDTNNSIKD